MPSTAVIPRYLGKQSELLHSVPLLYATTQTCHQITASADWHRSNMAEPSITPPFTIASLRAIREKKRQLAPRPLPSPVELTHREIEVHSPLEAENETVAGLFTYTARELEKKAVDEQEELQLANPCGHTHGVLQKCSVFKQIDVGGNATEFGEKFERPAQCDTLVFASDEPAAEHIKSIIAALHLINEPTSLTRTQAQKFRRKKRLGLALLQDALAHGQTEQGLPVTPPRPTELLRGRTINAVEKDYMADTEVVKKLCTASGIVTPSERARSMLLRPETITMAVVQALGQNAIKTNSARSKVLRLLQTEEKRPAGSKMDRWLDDGVQEHLQVMHAKAHPLESKPFHGVPTSAPRGIILGKRSTSALQRSYNGSYTRECPPASEPEFEKLVADDADPALIATWRIVSDLQKDAMQDIETQVIVPTIFEYLDVVKRRKLGTLATEHGTSTDYRPSQSHEALAAEMPPDLTSSSWPPRSLGIDGLLKGIKAVS
jgi:hypothetical protein